MCWDRYAASPFTKQKVFFSSPPNPTDVGEGAGQGDGGRDEAARARIG